MRELGGDTLNLPADFADGTREPLEDVARNLERWVAGARHPDVRAGQGGDASRAAALQLHVINALTDEEHPCQALADMLTLRERWGDLPRTGPSPSSATATTSRRRWPTRPCMLGVQCHIASPQGYELPDARDRRCGATSPRSGARRPTFTDPREAVAGVDAVYTDVWTSMGEEDEAAERRERVRAVSGERRADGGRASRTRCSCTACRRIAAKKSPPR